MWLYSGKVVVFGQNWLFSGKVVVFGKNCCIRAKWLYLGESGCIWENGCIRTILVYLKKVFFFRTKVVVFGKD